MRPRARSANPGLTNLQVKVIVEPKQGHNDGFELMKIMDVENNCLTNAKQQWRTSPSRLNLGALLGFLLIKASMGKLEQNNLVRNKLSIHLHYAKLLHSIDSMRSL